MVQSKITEDIDKYADDWTDRIDLVISQRRESFDPLMPTGGESPARDAPSSPAPGAAADPASAAPSQDRPSGGTSSTRPLVTADVAKVESVPGVEGAELDVTADVFLLDSNRKLLNGGTSGQLRPFNEKVGAYRLTSGRAPGGGEVALPEDLAQRLGLRVGDTFNFLSEDAGVQSAKVSGLARLGPNNTTLGFNTVLVSRDTLTSLAPENREPESTRMLVKLAAGADRSQTGDAIAKVLDGAVEVNGPSLVRSVRAHLKDDYKSFTFAVLAFALIAIVVSTILVATTFTMSVSQRARELALMRTIGATGTLIHRLVLVEAAAISFAATVGGMAIALVGTNLALNRQVLGITTSGGYVPGIRDLVIVVMVGIFVPVVSAILPARRAARIAPIEALQRVHSTESAKRFGGGQRLGLLMLVLGGLATVAMAQMDASKDTEALLALGFLGLGGLLGGFALIARSLVGPFFRLIGPPVKRFGGPIGNVAVSTAIRTPRRTAATSVSLMVGVALIVICGVTFSTIELEIEEQLERTGAMWDLNVRNVASLSHSLPPDTGSRLQDIDGTSSISTVRSSAVSNASTPRPAGPNAELDFGDAMYGVNSSSISQLIKIRVNNGRLPTGPNEIALVGTDRGNVGSTVTLRTAGLIAELEKVEPREATFTVVGIITEMAALPRATYLVDNPAFDRIEPDAKTLQVLIDLRDGADSEAVRKQISDRLADVPQASAQTRAQFTDQELGGLTQARLVLFAMLGVSIIIAMFGIINTTLMSVSERTSEIGMMRAVGATESDMRAMVRTESILVAVFGTLLGTVVGVGFGFAVTMTFEDTKSSIPFTQLIVLFIIAAVIGVVAAIIPAKRAAQMNILAAIATD